MSTRNVTLQLLLWLSVVALSTWVGGTLYQMLVIVPMWSASPPDSVRSFFQGTEYNHLIFRFFGPPFMLVRTLPVLAAAVVGWHLPRHRYSLLLASGCLGFAIVFTVAYIYPINAALFEQAGGTHSAAEIRVMANQWIFADRLRFAVGLVTFAAVLWAFKLPIPER
jgi:hypothetical protein